MTDEIHTAITDASAPPARGFWRSVFSETDGTGSSSRLLTAALSLGSLGALITIVVHLIRLHDPSQLSLWLASVPALLSSLTLFSVSPYTANKVTGSIGDVFNSLRK